MDLSLKAFHMEGGGFVILLLIVFILAGLGTFVYLESTNSLSGYKFNMFSSIGSDEFPVLEETSDEIKENGELSIGLIDEETEEEDLTADIEEPIEEPIKKDFFEKIAQKGDSVTTLAREVVTEYLEENSLDLSKEHRVYIEDYIQKRIGDFSLDIGESLKISKELITQGIEKAEELTQNQLEELENYSELVFNPPLD
jgi:predicted DNA-binding protein YlxM (UPF0122 family)